MPDDQTGGRSETPELPATFETSSEALRMTDVEAEILRGIDRRLGVPGIAQLLAQRRSSNGIPGTEAASISRRD
jgi:hypothetical protein